MSRTLFLLFFSVLGFLSWINQSRPASAEQTSTDSQEIQYLRKQLALFQSFSATRQQQIRQFDQQLHILEPALQEQYRKVMHNYVVWLYGLPEAQRSTITSAQSPEAKLAAIKKIQEEEWLDRLPKSYKDKYAQAASVEERADLRKLWQEEQLWREEEWAIVQKGEQLPEILRKLFDQEEMKKYWDLYLNHLEQTSTNELEIRQIQTVRRAKNEGDLVTAARSIYLINKRRTLLPGDGPRSWEKIPAAVQAALEKQLRPNQIKQLGSKQIGRWPDYAIAVMKVINEQKIKIPQQFGPCTAKEMPGDVRLFIENTLFAELQKTPTGKADWKRLQEAEGRWPDYPQLLMQISKQYKLSVPGYSLPLLEQWIALFEPLLLKKERK